MRLLAFAFCLGLASASVHAESDEIGLLEIFNYYEYSPRLLSSGQPTREQYPAIANAGIEAVINLAPVTEPGAYADEGDIATGLGLDYVHIPIDWEAPTRADLEAFFAAMERFEAKRVLVHCYANARASAFVYLWRTLRAGADNSEAQATMIEIWDWNQGYELNKVAHWERFVTDARRELAASAHPAGR